LLLGAAGAGKTTLLLELARELLSRAGDATNAGRADGTGMADDTPVPVVLLLSRWADDPRGIAGWIVTELAEHYKLSADRARRWLAAGQLTLLLDGLDEVPADRRADCVRAINAFRRSEDGGLAGLVVSSRTADYADLDV